MKSLTVIVCVLLLQVMWLSFSNGQDPDCATLTEKNACCSSNSTCVFVTCLKNNTTVSGCYNATANAGCDTPENATDICKEGNNSTTTPAATQTNVTTQAPSGGNANVTTAPNANGTANVTTAPNANGTANVTTAPNAKNETANTTAGPTTAGTGTDANATTGATNASSPVNCSSFNASQTDCCSAGNSTACIFFNCSSSGNLTSTYCVAAGSTPKCASKNETASSNICAASPSGGPNPTQAPSGGDSGGQKFDASSFIGGIVLCAGLIAIAYFGVKFYRSKQERNYESM